MKSALLRLCFLALVGTSGLFAQGANAQLVGRIDHNVTDSYRVFGRFAHNRTVLTQPDSYGNVATPDPGAPLRAHPPPAWDRRGAVARRARAMPAIEPGCFLDQPAAEHQGSDARHASSLAVSLFATSPRSPAMFVSSRGDLSRSYNSTDEPSAFISSFHRPDLTARLGLASRGNPGRR